MRKKDWKRRNRCTEHSTVSSLNCMFWIRCWTNFEHSHMICNLRLLLLRPLRHLYLPPHLPLPLSCPLRFLSLLTLETEILDLRAQTVHTKEKRCNYTGRNTRPDRGLIQTSNNGTSMAKLTSIGHRTAGNQFCSCCKSHK
jgi:hypothetical protein